MKTAIIVVLIALAGVVPAGAAPPALVAPIEGAVLGQGSATLSAKSEHVIGGAAVSEPHPYPFAAALMRAAEHDPFQAQFCGGTLISPSWILTAGHCVTSNGAIVDPTTIDVSVGLANLAAVAPASRIKVVQITRHPGYVEYVDGSTNNDVAMLRLRVPSPFSPAPMPLAGDTRWTAGRPNGMVAGWGRTDAHGFPLALQEGRVRIYDRAACWQDYRLRIYNSQLCAGNWRGVPTVCDGDSGGPLLRLALDGQWVLVGVTNWGPPHCTTVGQPPVFAGVPHYRSWIDSVLASAPSPSSSTAASVTISVRSASPSGRRALLAKKIRARVCSDFSRVLVSVWGWAPPGPATSGIGARGR